MIQKKNKAYGVVCECGHSANSHQLVAGCTALKDGQSNKGIPFFKKIECDCEKYYSKPQRREMKKLTELLLKKGDGQWLA